MRLLKCLNANLSIYTLMGSSFQPFLNEVRLILSVHLTSVDALAARMSHPGLNACTCACNTTLSLRQLMRLNVIFWSYSLKMLNVRFIIKRSVAGPIKDSLDGIDTQYQPYMSASPNVKISKITTKHVYFSKCHTTVHVGFCAQKRFLVFTRLSQEPSSP